MQTPKASQFHVVDSRTLLCGLNVGELVHIFGIADLRVLKGAVDVLGSVMRPSSACTRLYSPRSKAFLSICHCAAPPDCYDGMLNACEAVFELTARPDDPLMQLEAFSLSATLPTAPLFAQLMRAANVPSSPTGTCLRAPCLDGLYIFDSHDPWYGVLLKELPISGFFDKPPAWSAVASDLSDLVSKGGTPSILVCGDRKVGKSTFARYLSNSLLNACRHVAYIDLDAGQTEFVPPCLLAAEVIDRPFTGPPYCHLRVPDIARYYGGMSPSDNPSHYFACCRALVSDLRRHLSERGLDVPIVFNTMGWITGLGYDVLQFLLQLIRPSHVVSLTPPPQGEHADYISTALHTKCRVDGIVRPVRGQVRVCFVEPVRPFAAKAVYSPADLRSILHTVYFHAQLDETGKRLTAIDARPLTQFVPYEVPWSTIHLLILGKPVPHEKALLVSSLVGLAVSKHSTAQCLGVGIVRGIDVDRKTYHILTPLPLSVLSRVDTFLVGTNCAIPLPLLLEDGCVLEETPHLSYDVQCDAAGATMHRVRRNLLRKTSGPPPQQ